MLKEYSFIIVGGGICGLQIGALCSRMGKVLILEKSSSLGGRVRVVSQDGFLLDWGPHPIRFGSKSAIAETMAEIGKAIKFHKPGLMYAYMKDQKREIFPSGLFGMIKTKMIPKIKTLKFLLNLRKDIKKSPDGLRSVSLKEYFDENDTDPKIRKFLEMVSASLMVNPFPDRSSIGELYSNFIQVLKKGSVFYPNRGWNKILFDLRSTIEANRGKIRLNSEVKQIIVENDRAIGVEVDGEIINGDRIVIASPVQNLFSILDPDKIIINEKIVKKYNNLRQTSGIVIDFCLSKRVTDETLVFFEDLPSFGLIASNLDHQIAPPGKSLMSFFLPTDISMIKDSDKRKELHTSFRNQILKTYPQIEEYLEFERPLFLEMVDGVEIAVDQNTDNRPNLNEIKIENLFLTGDSIGGTGAGGDVGHTSVRECYERIKKSIKYK